MSWYEYLGSTVFVSTVALLPVVLIFLAAVYKNIGEKFFFAFVGSLLSYGILGILSIITIPMEFIWNVVVNPLICAPVQGSASICKIAYFLFDYGFIIIIVFWAISTFFVLKALVTRYWDAVLRAKQETLH